MIAICVPIYDAAEAAYVTSLWSLQPPEDGGLYYLPAVGMLLDDARREMTARALAVPEVTHLLFLDADMTFGPDALVRLLAHGMAIVGGLCFERRPPFQPTVFRAGEDGIVRPDIDYPRDQLVKVASTGGAFLLVARQVFEAIGEKFGDRLWWISSIDRETGLMRAGDESFLARARACGYDVYVDTAVKIGHVGKIEINESFVDRWRKGA